jgi:hypothetical protein
MPTCPAMAPISPWPAMTPLITRTSKTSRTTLSDVRVQSIGCQDDRSAGDVETTALPGPSDTTCATRSACAAVSA